MVSSWSLLPATRITNAKFTNKTRKAAIIVDVLGKNVKDGKATKININMNH